MRLAKTVAKYYTPSNAAEILDFGSHTGVLALVLQHHGYKVTSTDLDVVIDSYIENYDHNSLQYDRLEATWEKLPYVDDTFDCVIYSEVLEHLYESPIKMLQEIYRILKPKGLLILSTPNVMKLENKVKFLLNINIYQDIERYCHNPRHSLHFREYTEKDLKILLTKYLDFTNLKFHFFDFVGGRTLLRRILQRTLYFISAILYKFRGSIMVIAQK